MYWLTCRNNLFVILVFLSTFSVNAQNNSLLEFSRKTVEKSLKFKVEANPTSLEAHNAFISAFKINDLELEEQYRIWIKKYPKLYIVPFVIGKAYVKNANPKAYKFLLYASTLNPKKAEIWSLLAENAIYTNNIASRQEYLRKAMECDPTNPDYAFNYASTFKGTNPIIEDSLYLEVARKFPNDKHGAQSLYWLARKSTIQAEKITYYQLLYNRKSNQLFDWYLSGMKEYFDLLLKSNPVKAYKLGLTLVLEGKRNLNVWKDRLKVANAFLKARILLNDNNPEDALTTLNQVNLGSIAEGNFIDAKECLLLHKAEALNLNHQASVAYDSLAVYYSKTPSEELHAALYRYGKELSMDTITVDKSIWNIRNSQGKLAEDFSLENYITKSKMALSDFRGRVILLTYWFPSCGPCRAEFPYFEEVLKKVGGKSVVYLGLNLEPSEDNFVLPFLKESGYSFIALRDYPDRNKGNLRADGAPTNYLIDQNGKILFSNFTIDANNEKTLELMIKETVAAKDY